ncbi:hypothetical protein TSUD_267400 [Trifolium subterraneum]|uniref:Protein kinase domain-containing protein n=1 Tax=Trifolium subterraneum TaxID=3900 RepID=A0A2Z6N3Z4_TRISU|nr:hypothetical protein TSUD_267400 [Trifolium subterraneum]
MQDQFIIILSLFLVLFNPFLVISLYQPFNEDMLGLIVFKAGLEDPKNKLSSWNEDDYSPCNWEGVKCDPTTNRVSSLVLDGFSLSGHIGKSLMKLQFLQILSLSKNNFTGKINHDLLVTLWNLKVVDLSENSLFGTIPDELFRQCWSLRVLSLAKNNLSEGAISLNELRLQRNLLGGRIPVQIGKCSALASMNLAHNKLIGSIPSSIADLTNLQHADFSWNKLTGTLPKKLTNLTHLSSFNVSYNNLHAISIVVGVIAITFLNIHVRSSNSHYDPPFGLPGGKDYRSSPEKDSKCGKVVMFNGDVEFTDEPNNLLKEGNEIGRGGFGIVYCVVLRDQKSVAIKKLIGSSLTKSHDDFASEVQKLGKIRHENLVAIEGYYWNTTFQLIIYEYFSRGNLHKLLHDDNSKIVFSWSARFKVILGIAKGLAYLHQMNIIHYNMKSTNVFIDFCDEPKIGDFGLVNLLPILDHCVLSSKIQSALGYTAPEFACRTVNITEKCDVYGFGILVLEIVSGKRPMEYMEDDVVVLCDMVRSSLEDGKVEQCVDDKLVGNFSLEEAIPVIKLGLVCSSHVPSNRPNMDEVVNILETIECSSEGQQVELQ